MKRRRLIDPVRVQFSVAIRKKRGVKIAPEAIEMLIKRWMQGEHLPQGIIIRAVAWINPDRTRPQDRDWRGAGERASVARLLRREATTFRMVHANPEDARESLAALAATQPIQIKVGNS